MEVGDENLPPSIQTIIKTESTVCASPRSPGAVRSVLADVNTSKSFVCETKIMNELGSGTNEEEKCEAVAVDLDAEAWSERTAVITRYDHETHCDLARGFVEDLANKVVEENFKEPEQKKENFKAPTSLHLKKQKLFLPDLVPNVAASGPPTDVVSESDEYESADEQPQLQDTLYLDSTVHPSTAFDASTPIDTPGWHLDFDSSHVFPVGDVTVDASLKDYSLPTVDSAPESLPHIPAVNAVPKEETDSLGAIANFPARTSQPFSPSSGSDVDVSVLDSESDTLAAVTPINPSNEVDVDLITQFERLMLSKQVLSKQSPATPTLNTTFPLSEDENTPIVAVNQTVSSSVYEEEDILPADATRDVLSVTRDVSVTNQDDSEFASFLDQPSEHSSFADLKGHPRTKNFINDPDCSSSIVEDQKPQVIEEENEEIDGCQEEIVPVVEEEIISTVEESVPVVEEEIISTVEESVPVKEEVASTVVETVPVKEEENTPAQEEVVVSTVEETVPVVEEETVPAEEKEIVPAEEKVIVLEGTVPDLKEEIVPAVEETVSVEEKQTAVQEKTDPVVELNRTVPVVEEETVPVAEEEIVPVAEEEIVPVNEEETVPVVEKETVLVVEETVPVLESEVVPVIEGEPVSVVEKETVAIEEDQIVSEKKTVPDEEEQNPAVTEELSLTINKEEIVSVVEEQPTSIIEIAGALEPVDISSSEVDTVPAEGDSTFASTGEQTVLNAADKSCPAEVSEAPSEENQTSAVTEDVLPELSSADAETTAVKPTSLPEEKPIVTKKGYDLSFLDRFDDLENATPSISQAKLLPQLSTPISDSSALRVITEQESGPSTPVDQQVEKDEAVVTTPQVDVDQETSFIPITSQESEESKVPAQDETIVEEKPAEVSVHSDTGREACEEAPLIVPKKGYDLSFLDKLEDLENASPVATVNGSQETKMKESMSTNDKEAEPTEEQQSSESKSEKPAGTSPTKKAPFVRKPIRPRVARPAANVAKSDAFEVEFAFDPNEDPFKPKKKLGASPTRDGSPKTQNDVITSPNHVDNTEANSTVIESIPQSMSPKPEIVSERLSNNGSDQEEFRPAQEVFHDPSELDFLMQHGGATHDIALARQSLFVKFDPLVTGRPSMFPPRSSDAGGDDTILAEEDAARKSAGESLFLFSPPHSSSAPKVERTEPVEKSNPPECLMSSHNVAGDVLSLNEHKEALKLQELLFQDKLLQKEREILMKENENQDMKSKYEATVEAQAQMRQIVGEYEKTISQLIAEKEREKANMETTLQSTIKERDQAIEDVKEVERAFSEFHRMYERNRTAAENLHKNEEALKKALAAYQERLQQEQHKYETLKLHAAQKLEGAQQEMENLKRNLEGESSRVKAQLKKTEMRLASVEQSLEQKSKENEELTTLCDELINKLGSSAK
ncbi:transforming acidic coiled-coil-containing protein 2-like isoform X3 [Daphnia pulicaria]|uniref:transforming acidic coiled-coil-containing protein 2-like isoform X3 n=1 Tax=Daphnia pulicaria TaxID=35523 RepID=UPI001EECC93B|nr:transforming acidic coiled-coil-containing protein 2-like isoform X3 [Daphnia pulicaria]